MKKNNIPVSLVCIILLVISFTHCRKDNPNPDNAYISLYPYIYNEARVNESNFEINDNIGIYVVPYEEDNITPGKIEESEYAKNIEYIYNGLMWLMPSGSKIPWPNRERKVDIYSYYPYDNTLTNLNPSEYYFSVKTDQQTKDGYVTSDLLWTKKLEVSPTALPVDLSFYHILSKVRINIKTDIDTLITQLSNASVIILNTANSVTVNLSDGSISNPSTSETQEIKTFRHSSPAEGYLLNTEAIINPQTIESGTAFLRIEMPVNGVRYTYVPTENIVFESGKERTINITVTRLGLSVSVGSIIDWQPSDVIEGDIGKPIPKVLDLNTIDWKRSLVQNIYDNGIKIGQICKEYVYKNGVVDFQAIVIYNMRDDGFVDQSSGFVAQVMNRTRNTTTNEYEPNSGSVHGGTVMWGTNNTLSSYVTGKQSLFNKVEFSDEGINSVPDHSITTLNIIPELLIDADGNNYPVVKISSQYWMAENLKTEHYRDGSSLTYYYYNDDITNKETFGALYDWYTITDLRNISPQDWFVPVNNDFISLYQYLTPDAARKLKANIVWSNLSYNDNVTGFSALPGGRRTNTGTYNEAYNYGQWWSSTSTSDTEAYRIYFYAGSNAITNATLNKNYTQSVRLLRNF